MVETINVRLLILGSALGTALHADCSIHYNVKLVQNC